MNSRKFFKELDVVIDKGIDPSIEIIAKITNMGTHSGSVKALSSKEFYLENTELATFGNVMQHFNKSVYWLKRYKKMVKFAENISKILSILRSTFDDDNLDIKLCEDRLTIGVIIKFPKVRVSNSSGLYHDIYNFYVRFAISIDPNYELVRIFDLSGLKTDFTKSEILNDYIHSHINWGKDEKIYFRQFCMGDGEFADNYSYLSRDHRLLNDELINIFDFFQFSIEAFISWESIEGGPHRYISNLGKYSIINANSTISVNSSKCLKIEDEVFLEIDNNNAISNVEVINGDAFIVIDKETILESANKHSRLLNKVYHRDGVYYKMNQVEEERSYTLSVNRIYFKGSRLSAKEIVQEDSFSFTEEDKIVDPRAVNFIYKRLNNKFINYQILTYEPSRAEIKKKS